MFVPSYCGMMTFLCSRYCYIIIEKFSAVFLLRNIREHQVKELGVSMLDRGYISIFLYSKYSEKF